MANNIVIEGPEDTAQKDLTVKVTPNRELTVRDNDVITALNAGNPRKGKFFSLHLTNGGSNDMNVDGSVMAVDFTLSPPAGKLFFLSRMNIVLEDESINHLKFGGIAGGITNGLLLKVKEGGLAERDISEHPIKRNAEFHHIAFDVQLISAASDILTIRWEFFRSGSFLELRNSRGDNIKATVQDDLRNINEFEIICQGYEVDE